MSKCSGNSARGPTSGLAWSAFLGCSWTWCIGMFLPVLLVRDFGVAGFLVFAIPNILGAAAMGRVLPDAASSKAFVDRHRAACAAFSIVTIVFHLFFIRWMAARMIMPFQVRALLAAAFVVMFFSLRRDRGAVMTGWVVFVVSAITFLVALSHPLSATVPLAFAVRASPVSLLGLEAVCVLGFLLCPYLDLTFHRARQATSPRQGIIAFVAGFGGIFASMILFTLWYARFADLPLTGGNLRVMQIVGVHMAVQSAFTCAAHFRALETAWSAPAQTGALAGLLPSAALLFLGQRIPAHVAYSQSEVVYRLFLSFYGLLFPAYLWIGAPSLRQAWPLVVACAVAAPMYWLGFIDNRMLWLVPGVAVVFLARFITAADHSRSARGAAPMIYQDAGSKRAR